MRRKIAVFITDLTGGGAERVTVNLVAGLSALDCDVDLILTKPRGPLLNQVPPGVRLIDLGARHTMTSALALARYLKREQPVSLLSALNQPNVIAILAKRLARVRSRVVISIHNTLSVEAASGSSPQVRIMPLFAKHFYRYADEIVCVSHGSADDLAQLTGIARGRIRVIYNPVVPPELLIKAKARVDHDWFAEGRPPVILAVGRLHVQKDYPTLLKAFQLAKDRCTARLMILGEGEDRADLETLAQQLGISDRVAMPGYVANPYAFMRRARLLVLSSRWEGLPTVLIEALACGTPVISTDCPSGPKEILANGKYGILVPTENPQTLAEAMVENLRSTRQISPPESWRPFLNQTATQAYYDLLLCHTNGV